MGQLRTETPPQPDDGHVLFDLGGDESQKHVPMDRGDELVIDSGSSFELFAGMVAIASAVIALTGYEPVLMASLATVAVGFALLAQGATIATRWHHSSHIAGSERAEALGISTELFGGLAGIVLGIVALFGVVPLTLLSVASMTLGLALLLGGPAQPDLEDTIRGRRVTRDLVRSSSGVMVMAGLAALVLGIVAVIAGGPVAELCATSMIVLGGALVLAGGAIVAQLARRFG